MFTNAIHLFTYLFAIIDYLEEAILFFWIFEFFSEIHISWNKIATQPAFTFSKLTIEK